VLDARRCISYLTIELRGTIPAVLREPMGDWLFGCDICQEVCPFNQPRAHQPLRAAPTAEPRLQPRPLPSLEEILTMDEAQFQQRFQGRAIRRAKWRGLIRNALVVAGNSGNRRYLPLIERFLHHPDPLLREHARWAWERIHHRAEVQTAGYG
jgi:epoxyqueuosine reductase